MLQRIALQLYLAAKFNPSMYDAIFPMSPKYSVGTRKVIAAQLMKSLSAYIKNASLQKDILAKAKTLYESSTREMRFDIDDICPRPKHIPIHFPIPWPDPNPWDGRSFVELNPQPQPPEYYKAVLNLIAESIDDSEFGASLQKLSDKIE